jgi:hypothetical protein
MTTQCKAHLQPILKGRYYFGCKSALHFPFISFFIFLPSLKTKFSATLKSPADIRQPLNNLLCLTRQLSIPLKRLMIRPVYNFALLQWRVVDGAAQCSLITIARRTRQTSSDKSATASNAGRWLQCFMII